MTTKSNPSVEAVIRNAVTETVKFQFGDEIEEGTFRPPMDLRETALEYVAYIDLPGVDEDALEFTWYENMLCIGGCRDFNHDTEDPEEFVQLQRKYGPFVCRIPLNDSLDVSNATAKYKRGVLKVSVPKKKVHARVL